MNTMEKVGWGTAGVVVAIPIVAIMIAYHALAFWFLWGWFLVPLGIVPISYVHACGLMLFFSLSHQVKKDYKWPYDKTPYTAAVLLRPAATIAVGYVIKELM
jgi:fatty acid desaturase